MLSDISYGLCEFSKETSLKIVWFYMNSVSTQVVPVCLAWVWVKNDIVKVRPMCITCDKHKVEVNVLIYASQLKHWPALIIDLQG